MSKVGSSETGEMMGVRMEQNLMSHRKKLTFTLSCEGIERFEQMNDKV